MFRRDREISQSNEPFSSDISVWLEKKVEEYTQQNAQGRARIQAEIVSFAAHQLSSFPQILEYLMLNCADVGQQLAYKLLTSQKICAAVRKQAFIPQFEDLVPQLELITRNNLSLDLLRSYFEAFSDACERVVLDQEVLEQWPMIRSQAVKLSTALIRVIFRDELPVEKASNLVRVWSQEADKESSAGNILHWLTLAGMDESDPEMQENASSSVEILLLLEESLLGLGHQKQLERQKKSEQEFAKRKRQVLGKQGRNSDWFFEQWKYRLEAVKQYKAGDAVFFLMAIPSVENPFTHVANSLFLSRQVREFPESEFWSELIFFPDGGVITLIGKREKMTGGIDADDLRKILGYYFSEVKSEERYFDISPRAMILLCEAFIPVLEVEKLELAVQESRAKAAGGMSTVSGKGDAVIFRERHSEAERYLTEKGMTGITFYQVEDGVQAVLHWFNIDIPLKINEHYQLQREVGLELTENQYLWLETLLLSYLGGIKQNLKDVEWNKKLSPEGSGSRLFTGRRPFLKVLPFGQQSSQVDYEFPDLSDEEVAKFVMTHFGVSLFTLNKVFHDIQDSVVDLRTGNFEILIQGYEELLPQQMRMRTNVETVRSMLVTAVKRTVSREYKVRYSRNGLLVSPNLSTENLHSSQQRYSISLTHEARPKTEIQVEPMTFWCPEVSAEIMALEQGL